MNSGAAFTIIGELPTLNTYINANRANRYVGAKIKRQETERVFWAIKLHNTARCTTPPFITFRWYCKNTKSDKDNIAFAKKFILDGMVLAKLLPDDGWDNIKGFSDMFFVDKDNPRIEVWIAV